MKSIQGTSILRKALALLLLCCVITAAAACSAEKAETDFYKIGRDVIKILDEMLRSREYQEFFLTNDKLLDLVDQMYNTGDYDSPVAVYRLNDENSRQLIMSMIPEDELGKLNALSPTLQDQLWKRTEGLSYLANIINAKKGTEVLATSSALTAVLNVPELEPETTEYYLFVFEKGVPVIVSCGWHGATGMILALDAEERESADALRSVFEPWGYEVIPCEIP